MKAIVLSQQETGITFGIDPNCGRYVVHDGRKYLTSSQNIDGCFCETWFHGGNLYAVRRAIPRTNVIRGLASIALG